MPSYRVLLRSLYPELNIVPDQRNNRLILQGKRELTQEAENLLALLDTEKEAIADVIAIPADKRGISFKLSP